MAPSGDSIPHRHNAESAYGSVTAEDERRGNLHHHSHNHPHHHQSSNASSIHAAAAAAGAMDHQVDASGASNGSFDRQPPSPVSAEAASRHQFPSFLASAAAAAAASAASASASTAGDSPSSSSSSASSTSSASTVSTALHGPVSSSEARCMQIALGPTSRMPAGDARDPRSSTGCVMDLEGCDGTCAHACSSSQATTTGATSTSGVGVSQNHDVSCLDGELAKRCASKDCVSTALLTLLLQRTTSPNLPS